MSEDIEYVTTDEHEQRVRYATSALEGIVIAAVITGNQSFQEPKNIAGAAFEIADAMMKKEKECVTKEQVQ